jgi:molybdopterin synthase sulfur carrier subunit
MAVIRIPGALRQLSGGEALVSVAAADVRSALQELDSLHPGFRDRILDDRGEPRQFVNIYVNDQDIRSGGGLDSTVKESDEISIIPAVAGGF